MCKSEQQQEQPPAPSPQKQQQTFTMQQRSQPIQLCLRVNLSHRPKLPISLPVIGGIGKVVDNDSSKEDLDDRTADTSFSWASSQSNRSCAVVAVPTKQQQQKQQHQSVQNQRMRLPVHIELTC